MINAEVAKLTEIYPAEIVGFGIKANGCPPTVNLAVKELIFSIVNGEHIEKASFGDVLSKNVENS